MYFTTKVDLTDAFRGIDNMIQLAKNEKDEEKKNYINRQIRESIKCVSQISRRFALNA